MTKPQTQKYDFLPRLFQEMIHTEFGSKVILYGKITIKEYDSDKRYELVLHHMLKEAEPETSQCTGDNARGQCPTKT